jgi:hypothetical protein
MLAATTLTACQGSVAPDEQVHTFTSHVQGALVRWLIGQVQTRVFKIVDDVLTVRSSDPDEEWQVRWQRDQ